jgi:hypothetical protein
MPDDALAQFENTVTGSATKIASLVNLAAGPTAVVGFLAEGIFKGIRLGMAIRSRAREINAKLDSTIRARSFVRTPIVVDLGEVDFRNFYDNKAVNIAAFPVLAEMGTEIAEFENTGGLVSAATKARLQAARALAEPLTNDPALNRPDNAELKKMFAIGLDPTKRTFRTLVEEYVKLYPDVDVTVGNYFDIAADFWRDKLQLEIAAIATAQLESQKELNQAVRQLIRDAFLGDEGFATKALGLATNLKKISIDKQIEELQKKLATAPDDKRADIQGQIDKLTEWKERLG